MSGGIILGILWAFFSMEDPLGWCIRIACAVGTGIILYHAIALRSRWKGRNFHAVAAGVVLTLFMFITVGHTFLAMLITLLAIGYWVRQYWMSLKKQDLAPFRNKRFDHPKRSADDVPVKIVISPGYQRRRRRNRER